MDVATLSSFAPGFEAKAGSPLFGDPRCRLAPAGKCRLIKFTFAGETNEFKEYKIIADGELGEMSAQIPLEIAKDEVFVIFNDRGLKKMVADANQIMRP